jgi:glycosyltransferase involved in cell wall biosynthesis
VRVLLVNTLYPPLTIGGAEESVFELASDLAADGHEVAVACLAPPIFAEPEVPVPGVTVHRLQTPVVGPFFADRTSVSRVQKAVWHAREAYRPVVGRFLRGVVETVRPDVINTHNIAGFGAVAWSVGQGIPLIHTLRDYYLLCVSVQTYRNGRRCAQQCRDCAVMRAPVKLRRELPDVYVGISGAILERHRRFGFLPEGVRSTVISNQPQATWVPRVTDAIPTFGFLGRVEAFKGIWAALEAFADLPGEAVRFVVAGDAGPVDEDRLRKIMADDSRVTYLGRVAKEEFYRRVDTVVVPSQWDEPFGRVAAEAVGSGAAVLVSNVGGLPEAVAHAPAADVVDEYQDARAWRAAMARWSGFIRDESEQRVRGPESLLPVAEQYGRLFASLRAAS